ncbi:exported hypothetical protein [Candidatus Contendobacter odensis Run_B_J11]|uniref:HAF repeat-containing protein n=1 Tax=Candidatus Contendobacter odensis Run_B_J11 TaxID=1400861 RepID=A0A7U7GCI7_9GAMM|nr:exported hypothetical protein [Candidatus Contendobacter odensis Run_B_J11]
MQRRLLFLKNPSILLIIIVIFSFPVASQVLASSYAITDLGTLGGTKSVAAGINQHGQVIGFSTTAGESATHAFLYSGGRMTDLGSLGGTKIYANGINASGQIVGSSTTAGERATRAFWYANGGMTDLGTLGGTYSAAFGINASGQIVGESKTAGDSATHAFLYSGGRMSDLGTLGGANSSALGINAIGQIVGYSIIGGTPPGKKSLTGSGQYSIAAAGDSHAFLYSGGRMIDLGTLGGTQSFAISINDSGQVVGSSTTAGNSALHAFRYANGVMIDLGTLGGTQSIAFSINNGGQVFGASTIAGDRETHLFLHTGGRMIDLNPFFPAGWFLGAANAINGAAAAINDAGQMVGSGTINGQTHAFLMSPIGQDLGSAIGVFRNGQWFLDANGNGAWDGCGTEFCFTGFGQAGDMPASGNWNGGSKNTIGVLRSGTGEWFIDRNGNRQWDGCVADGCYSGFGQAGDLPVAGDWNGTSFAKIGVFRNGQWFLDNGNGKWDGCGTDLCLSFGQLGDLPVAGNWNGGLKAGVGVFRAGTWFLDYNGNGQWDGCDVDRCYFGSFGQAGDFPVAGDWNGDGKAKVGVFRAGTWYLDYNGNGAWDGCGIDRCYFGSFGKQGDLPVAGRW